MPDEIEPGATIFIDANIFLYKILDHWKYAEPCGNLLKDVSRGKYTGVVSVIVCSEVFHRVMVAEVIEKYKLDPGRAVRYLKEKPGVVKELNVARSAIENIQRIENLMIAGVGGDIIGISLEYSRRYGLLSNDSIHLATMQKEGISTLASNDRDFERIEWISVWRP